MHKELAQFKKSDPLLMVALVIMLKIDLYEAEKDLFEVHGQYAQRVGELSSISKEGDTLCAHAKDPITAGFTLSEFVAKNCFAKTGAEASILGVGGSAISMGSI